MQEFIAQQNITRFERRLATETDPRARLVLRMMLDRARIDLAQLRPAHLGMGGGPATAGLDAEQGLTTGGRLAAGRSG